MIEILLLSGQLAVSVILGWVLARWWRGKRLGLVALAAAAPVPVLIAGMCAFVFISAAISPAERCGVDACGMAMMAAMFGFAFAVVLWLLGLLAALPSAYLGRRGSRGKGAPPDAEIFE